MKKTSILLFTILYSSFSFGQFIAFPKDEVRQILLMTSEEILEFSQKKEIELFKFNDPIPTESGDKATELLKNIPEVNKEDFNPFKEIFSGSTLGVYFSKYNISLNLKNDTVLYSDQADRWTIAHEMGHALIDKNRPLEQKKDEAQDFDRLRNAREDYEEVMSLYRNLGFFPNENYMNRALDSIKTWSNLMLSLLYTYELEEVRIEKYLISLYENEPKLKLDKHTYSKSFWYIEKNCTSAKLKLNNAKDVLEHFESLVTKDFLIKNLEKFRQQKADLDKQKKIINSLCPNV